MTTDHKQTEPPLTTETVLIDAQGNEWVQVAIVENAGTAPIIIAKRRFAASQQ